MTIRLGAGDQAGGDVYDLEIAAAGDTFFVRRSHGLMRRLEQVAGPLLPLVDRLQSAAITQSELERVYRALLEEERAAPTAAALRQWLFDEGTAKAARSIALDVLSLVAGNAVLRALTAEERRSAPDDGEVDQDRRPFSPQASSTGS